LRQYRISAIGPVMDFPHGTDAEAQDI